MKTFTIEFITILTMLFVTFTISTTLEDLKIFRIRSNGKDGWTKGTDTFKLPASLCGTDRNDLVNCARFGANVSNVRSENGQVCLCSCPNENATLMYQNDEWKCLPNSITRDLLGYNIAEYTRFFEEERVGELRMLNISDQRGLTLSQSYPECVADKESSSYIGCNGSEVSYRSRLFSIQKLPTDNDNSNFFSFVLKVNSDVSDVDFLRGRIVKLGSISIPPVQPTVTTRPQTTLTLSPSTSTRSRHLGNSATRRSPPITPRIVPTVTDIPTTVSDLISDSSPIFTSVSPTVSHSTPTTSEVRPTVSNSPPTVTDVSPTDSDSPLTVSSVHPTASDRPSTVTTVRPTASPSPSTTTDVHPTTSDTPPTTSEARPTTFDAPPTAPDTTTVSSSNAPARPNPDSERRTDNNSTSMALIAGIAITVLAIVVIIGFLVYRRRYSKRIHQSRTKCEERKETVITSAHTSLAYEPDGENAYKELEFREQPMYASSYEMPQGSSETHFTDSNPNTDHVYAPLNISEGQNIYGHVNTQEPVYRLLEGPTSDNEITSLNYGRSISVEPLVYNHVEELSIKGVEEPSQDGANDNQPVYNVLEEPYLEILQGPDQSGAMASEEPVYNTLEESFAERPDNETEFINEPIYNVLEEEPCPDVSA